MREKWLTFSDFLARHFQGKIQKIAVNAGFSCPNRDGTLGTGGCIYCNNESFTPGYCSSTLSVTEQLERGKQFFSRKYPQMRYLAYFQSYTSTYSPDRPRLLTLYEQAAQVSGVVGVIIGTRPDCVDPDLLRELKARLPWVMIEYGAETSHDPTLTLINRHHTWQQVIDAVQMTADAAIPVGLHLIMHLPGEDEAMMMTTIDRVNLLPVDVVKIHRLQVLTGTELARNTEKYHLTLDSAQEYAALCARIVSRLRPDIAIDRFLSQSPPDMVIAPKYDLKNYEFSHLVSRLLP